MGSSSISAGTTAYPVLNMHDVSNGPLQGDCIRYIRAFIIFMVDN